MKGQQSMEFLQTYGWAIVLTAAVFLVLHTSGILNVKDVIPSRCEVTPGFNCLDYQFSESKAVLVIGNGIGEDIVVDEITVLNPESGDSCASSPNLMILNGYSTDFTIADCTDLIPDSGKHEIRIEYKYSFPGDPTQYIGRGLVFTRREG